MDVLIANVIPVLIIALFFIVVVFSTLWPVLEYTLHDYIEHPSEIEHPNKHDMY